MIIRILLLLYNLYLIHLKCQITALANKGIIDIFESKLDDKTQYLCTNIASIRQKAEELLSTIPIIFPQYTRHDVKHKDKIIELYAVVFPNSLLEALNVYELYFLLAATYLHDIGMSNLAKLNDIDKTLPRDRKQIQIRDEHHIRTREYLKKFFDEDFKVSLFEGLIIGNICSGHRKLNLFDKEQFDPTYVYEFQVINIPLLAGMLRLADELDMFYSRAPKILFDNIPILDQKSVEEWGKHWVISGIATDNNGMIIKCSGLVTDPKIYNLIKEIENKVNQILQDLPNLLYQYSKYYKDLPRNFVADVDTSGFIPKKLSFTFDKRNMLNLFVSLRLYNAYENAIRELVKNSIDACNYRMAQHNDPNYKPQILVEIDKKKGLLKVSDNGIGMNYYDLLTFFSSIGKSIYVSKEFKEKEYHFTPLGELGIGLLSVFLITNNVIIETRKSDEEAHLIEIYDIDKDFIVRKSDRNNIGTSIDIKLKDTLAETLDILGAVKFYFVHPPFEIQVFDQTKTEVVKDTRFKINNKIKKIILNQVELSEFTLENDFFFGKLYLPMRKETIDGCKIPLKNYSSLSNVQNLQEIDLLTITHHGVRVMDKSILPDWFWHGYYLDINFHTDKLLLDASRNRFLYDEEFRIVKDSLESAIIGLLETYLKLIENNITNTSLMKRITNLFLSQFVNTWILANYKRHSVKCLEFIKRSYYFRCITNHSLTRVKVKEISKKNYVIVLEPPWENGNDEYLQELSKSNDFDPDVNYVIITRDESIISVDENLDETYIPYIFKRNEYRQLPDIIQYEIVNGYEHLLPPNSLLVKFMNYPSDNIMESIYRHNVINSQHPFIKLIISNQDLFIDPPKRLYLDYFWKTFDGFRGRLELEEVVRYQSHIIKIIQEHGNLGNYDPDTNVLDEDDFPPPSKWGRDII